MVSPSSIFLFDIDSVLIEPRGYRAALIETVRFFIDRMGLDHGVIPTLDDIEGFEAAHITSEWDMAPLILATILDNLAAQNPDIVLPNSVSQLTVLPIKHPIREIDYKRPIRALSVELEPDAYPADTALKVAGGSRGSNGSGQDRIFPHLKSTLLLADLLSNTRDPNKSYTTRIFQHHTLGSEIFTQVYQTHPEFHTSSLLISCDIPLLSLELRNRLLADWKAGHLALAAMTNRPSGPPREVTGTHASYAPEAEMALQVAGMNDIPLISFGRIRYLAEIEGLEPETLLKPSAMHAVSAVLAALYRDEFRSMQTALSLVQTGQQGLYSDSVQTIRSVVENSSDGESGSEMLHIHIFEDTRWGIDATLSAGRLLNKVGISNKVYPWGITRSTEKAASLEKTGAVIFADLETAVTTCLGALKQTTQK